MAAFVMLSIGKDFSYFDVIYHFIFVVIINVVIVEMTRADKITQAMRKEVNIREVENNTLTAIILR